VDNQLAKDRKISSVNPIPILIVASDKCRDSAVIAASFPDRRQNLGRDPFLKTLSLWLIGSKDQGIQAGFIDNAKTLLASRGIDLSDPLFIVIQPRGGV